MRQAGLLRANKLLALIVLLLPLRSFCVFSGHIDVGFAGSAMSYVDSNGAFLYSLGNTFSLSFFSSSDQAFFYLCIIHTASQDVVWTANRDSPISQSDQLVFSMNGNAALVRGGGEGSSVSWSTNTTGLGVKRMQMQDSGNLILLDESNNTVWQSFDHPTDTLLSGQVLRSGMSLIGSVADGNMSSGPYSLSLVSGDLHLSISQNYPDSPQPYWSMLHDSRLVSSGRGAPSYAFLNSTGLTLVTDDSVVVSSISWSSNAALCRASLQSTGNLLIYAYSSNVWTTQFAALESGCQLPLYCGPYGVCSYGQCSCPNPFQPLNENSITQGCQGLTMPPCTNSSDSGLLHFEEIGDGLDYFANSYTLPVMVSGLDACKQLCMQNCSCRSFFFYNESGSCFLFSQLGTIQSTGKSGHALYVKTSEVVGSPKELGSPDLASPRARGLPSFVMPAILGGSIFIVLALTCAFIYWFLKVHRVHFPDEEDYGDEDSFLESITGLPTRFTFKELQIATNYFSKKLGEGGFGSVYEGALPDRTKVAVKRLEGVGQGKKEFRAEIAIIGRIHHVHLVQLRGFCVEGFHRLLVYEFMPNSSLDKCLFVEGKNSKVLDWKTRYQIALGTARGLAYLHNDCREKIIHCDIKPENILLDENYNAKVSDFGLAKLLNREQSQVFTTMRGTRGYLAPEWLMNLAISEKSDVYSFGMVLLEVISGRKNYEPNEVSEKRYFPAYAFQQAERGILGQLVDEKLKGFVCTDELARVVRVALWCIQEETPARPSMVKVVQMLEGNMEISEPPLSSQFSVRMHARMVEAMNLVTEQSSSSSGFNKGQSLLSAVRLSAAR